MHIEHLTLHACDLSAQRTFYAGTLGLVVLEDTPERLTVRAGTTLLTFAADPTHDAFSHVAFDIPRNRADEAKRWLESRVPVLRDSTGRDRVLPSDRWNTTNVYFDDPAGNLLEFIARHDLPNDHTEPFGPESVLHVSELGLVVPDVTLAVHDLGERFGLRPFNGQSPTFTAIGEHDGMLIVVPHGRGWIPVARPALPAPFELAFRTGTQHQVLRSEVLPRPLRSLP
ncbi:hypothetical protein E7T09_01925 [Deinococcus sp. KSM4-11]|uniref:VOC family protein n=1 Tax=Deinococcus sp. KSM4-11 TaxID=2568654 RepID=UPI0010A2CD9D|nr:VOC family protein [Deinococcus sp. KSM4-11]THF88006.1 hypothetical protein E7T09_01925 [Deinococcus sp. KSM4-11]